MSLQGTLGNEGAPPTSCSLEVARQVRAEVHDGPCSTGAHNDTYPLRCYTGSGQLALRSYVKGHGAGSAASALQELTSPLLCPFSGHYATLRKPCGLGYLPHTGKGNVLIQQLYGSRL